MADRSVFITFGLANRQTAEPERDNSFFQELLFRGGNSASQLVRGGGRKPSLGFEGAGTTPAQGRKV